MSNIKPLIICSGTSSAAVTATAALSAAQWLNVKCKKLSDCDNEFVKVENLKASKGDLIEFRRAVHEHWGIYVGDGEIIDLVNLGEGKGIIRKEKLIEVAEDSLCRVNNLVKEANKRGLKPRDEKEILKEVYDKCDKSVNYCVLNFNCEHFATKCFYGTSFSVQSEITRNNPLANLTAKIFFSSPSIFHSDNEFVKVEQLLVNVGDSIEIRKESGDHWGIYVEEGYIIHLVNIGNKKGKVFKDLLAKVSNDCLCRVNNLVTEADKRGLVLRNKDLILKEAYRMLHDEIDYDYLNYNCEHFATNCLYGTAFSVQSDITSNDISENSMGRLCCEIALPKNN